MFKIDVFPHILPPKYRQALIKKLPAGVYNSHQAMQEGTTSLTDLDTRFRIMDQHEGLMQVLTLTLPFVETIAKPEDVLELVKIGNDELAELVEKYPERFPAAIGCLPMNDIDASLVELDRIINDLHLRGIQICTDMNGKPLDSPEFMPLYEKMEHYNLPILLHPTRRRNVADYQTEDSSKYDIYSIFGWPYDSTAAVTRLVFGRVLQKYPNIKFIIHHCGALIPYFVKRISYFYSVREMRKVRQDYNRGLTNAPIDYFKMFYVDTALYGYTPGLMCGYAFYGVDHMLFGTDMPFDPQNGYLIVKETIESIEQMQIPEGDKQKIFADNARRILRLPI